MPRNALGRGLSALIREPEPQPLPQPPPAAAPVTSSEALLHLDIDLIEPSPYQPRTRFREDSLEELARSIRATGIVQPLVVRRRGARYQLIAGERRWRAAQRSGMTRVPAVLRDVPEEMALEMTLIENLQREDLNPIEQAHAFQRLTDEFHLTQEQVAERTGKDRATIANSLRLLKLDPPIRDLLEEGQLTAGHGRALLSIMDSKLRVALARRTARGELTVRQIERLASRAANRQPSQPPKEIDANTKAALEELQRVYGTRVSLQPVAGGKGGRLIFEYYSDSDLLRLYDALMPK